VLLCCWMAGAAAAFSQALGLKINGETNWISIDGPFCRMCLT
jgi:hypothetical protein